MRFRGRRRVTLTATPNPVTCEGGRGTTIAWSTGDGAPGQVFVSEDGEPEELFASGPEGRQDANWIEAGSRHDFHLYAGTDHLNRLASVTVYGEDVPWPAVAATMMRYAARHEYWNDVAELVGNLVPRFLRRAHRARFFHLWEEHGFHVTPAHYYFPLPDTRELPNRLWATTSELVGIDMNDDVQLDLLHRAFPAFRDEYSQVGAGQTDDFDLTNPWFGGIDALVLYCMIRHFRPRLVLEVGSGFSTRVSLRAALQNGDTRVMCIEPHPFDSTRHDVFQQEGHGIVSLIPMKVEDVELALFQELQASDLLFIDSSHVSRIGGDVNYLFLEVLPRLNPGVLVHVHDIFLPAEYPRDWVMDNLRFFNEQYLLQAFLTLNREYSVLMANHYLGLNFPADLRATFPYSPTWDGQSFWIRRTA